MLMDHIRSGGHVLVLDMEITEKEVQDKLERFYLSDK
jgi:hypothetical protein